MEPQTPMQEICSLLSPGQGSEADLPPGMDVDSRGLPRQCSPWLHTHQVCTVTQAELALLAGAQCATPRGDFHCADICLEPQEPGRHRGRSGLGFQDGPRVLTEGLGPLHALGTLLTRVLSEPSRAWCSQVGINHWSLLSLTMLDGPHTCQGFPGLNKRLPLEAQGDGEQRVASFDAWRHGLISLAHGAGYRVGPRGSDLFWMVSGGRMPSTWASGVESRKGGAQWSGSYLCPSGSGWAGACH